jgi:Stage II sporulation protein/FG-GAP repeat
MPRRLAAGLAALALAAAATLPPAVPAYAAATCTGWTSQIEPPPTIRVYRTEGAAAGQVQRIDFRTYVERVMAGEWPAYWPAESLEAGAIAVKQYGWYWTMNYRGKTAANGDCYDVVDYWADQVYDPGKTVYAQHRAAVAATWSLHVRKSGAFFMPSYHAGQTQICGYGSNGTRMYQWGAYDCGRDRMARDGILRQYYYPALGVVSPGAHHVIGAKPGDGAVLMPAGSASLTARVYAGSGSSLTKSSTTAPIALQNVLGAVSADVTGDGRDDLVILRRDGAASQSLMVMRATASGYEPMARWWLAQGELSNSAIRLVAGYFDIDQRKDVGLLVGGANDLGHFYMLRSLGTAFATKEQWWAGTMNVRHVQAYAGDATGDGRADVIVELDRGTAGLSYDVLPSRPAGGSLGPRQRWRDAPDMRRSTTRTAVGDMNRDGRADVLLAAPSGAGSRLVALVAGTAAFGRTTLWSSSSYAISRVKIAGADLDYDGRGDVVMYVDRGAAGTRLLAFTGNGASMTGTLWLDDPGLPWSTARPY